MSVSLVSFVIMPARDEPKFCNIGKYTFKTAVLHVKGCFFCKDSKKKRKDFFLVKLKVLFLQALFPLFSSDHEWANGMALARLKYIKRRQNNSSYTKSEHCIYILKRVYFMSDMASMFFMKMIGKLLLLFPVFKC